MTSADTPSATHLDIPLDEDDTPSRRTVYVDLEVRDHERRPIVPAGMRPEHLPATARRALARTVHRTAYHTVRLPRYAALTCAYAVTGLVKGTGRQIRWAWLMEQTPLRQHTASVLDWDAWLKLHQHLGPVRKRRLLLLTLEAVLVPVGVLLLVWLAPWWAVAACTLVAVLLLARVGRPAGRQIVTPAVVTPRYRRLNADIVLRAYYRAGLGNRDKDDQHILFGGPMARDPHNIGSQVVVDLPYGKTFADVVSKRDKLASGLDVTEHQVYLTRDKTSTRRHLLFVADRDPLAVPAGRTPLLDCKPRDIWQPAPFGLDERGNRVTLLMMWNSILIGAQPRRGKTFSARTLALYAALDPYVLLTVVDGKNSPDWRAFRLVADMMIFGTHPTRDGDPVEQLLYTLRQIKADIQARNDKLSQLPVSICPEGKLTREISRNPEYGMPVWLLVMEEFQVYFETEDQDVNKEIAQLLSFIIAVGPSAGVILLDCSQKPAGVGAGDVARLFNRYRDNHTVRFALRCGNRNVSEAVLGGDAYSEGYDASSLPTGDEYRGIGYLYGAGDHTPTVRTYLADAADAEKILEAARKLREQAGTLTGMAAGENIEITRRDPLADVRRVFYAGEAWVSWQQIATRLNRTLPEAYAEVTPEAISAQIRAFGVESGNGRQGDHVLKGAKREHIDLAIKRREITES